jgi:FKBP-type peptidyl-prolyl cis-trans isomerase 2
LIFTVGSGQVIPWLDAGILGARVGKTKTITITPAKWYGKIYDENKVQKISQLIFDKLSITPKNGTTQKLGNIEWIVKWTEKDADGNVLVLFDINPRQTRDTLTYKVTVLTKK